MIYGLMDTYGSLYDIDIGNDNDIDMIMIQIQILDIRLDIRYRRRFIDRFRQMIQIYDSKIQIDIDQISCFIDDDIYIYRYQLF